MQLGNLYFDAERYTDAITWYGEALKLAPTDVDVSTDLGVSYYYTNQPDRALEQFETSLKLDPKHTKTLLNHGRSCGRSASRIWPAPSSRGSRSCSSSRTAPEGQAAKRALDSLQSAHPGGTATATRPGA